MTKIIRTSLTVDFISFDVSLLQLGSTISFDCYIKRFNGYVIIIEHGTVITEELLQKINKSGDVYFHKPELEQYKSYCSTYEIPEDMIVPSRPGSELKNMLTLDEIITNIDLLSLQLREFRNTQDKLRLIYKNACDLMSISFNHQDQALSIHTLELLIDETLRLIVGSKIILVDLIKMMPSTYKTECHSVNVFILSIFLGRQSDLQRTDLQQLALAAILHDIGKVGIDASILEKKGSLDDDEFEKVQEHSKLSVEIASKNMIRSKRVLDAILYHHERLDGTGYPDRLTGSDIPKFAQIIGICDTFDALTTDKTYRSKYSSFDALKLMNNEMTRQLNQAYVKNLIQLLHK